MYKHLISNKLVQRLIAPLLAAILLVMLIISTKAITMRKTFTVVINGISKSYASTAGTIGKALEECSITINEKDKVEPKLNDALEDGITINIKRAVNVTITADGKSFSSKSAENNVGDMLQAEGISLGLEDKVTPSLDNILFDNMTVKITRVETQTITETSEINYSDEYINDSTLKPGVTRILCDGTKGTLEITYKVVYEDGQKKSKEAVGERVTLQPINRKIAKGTAVSSNPIPSRGNVSSLSYTITVNGTTYTYSKEMQVKSTAYTGDTITHTGTATVRNPNGYSTIAVDPSVIPFGTKLYVEGYGLAIAADSGGAIKGNMIDVFFETYSEADEWGIKTVKIYILN